MVVRRVAATAIVALALLALAQPAAAADQWSLSQASVTPAGANFPGAADLQGISADGRHVFFRTTEALVPEDQNGFFDLYDRHDVTTELISVGPADNGFDPPAQLLATSPDGKRVFFKTPVPLLPGETSGGLYERFNGVTTRLPQADHFTGESFNQDASAYYFLNDQQLVPEDADTSFDLYRYDVGGATLTLISVDGREYLAANQGYSRDLSRIYFTTDQQLVPTDTDSCADLYVYQGGGVSLVSAPTVGNCPNTMQYLAESAGGHNVAFTTDKAMAPGLCCKLWERSGSELRAVSSDGIFNGLAADGSLYFTASTQELYRYSNGTSTLMPGSFVGIDSGTSRVFFQTTDALLPEDQDTTPDIYMQDGSYRELITSDAGWDSRGWGFVGVSDDGGRAFFSAITPPSGSPRCLWSHPVYGRVSTSTGLCAPNSQGPVWRISKDGRRAAVTSSSALLAADTDTANDVYVAALVEPTGYPRPKGATPIRVTLVPAYAACTSASTTHGAPLAFPACSPPSQASSNLTVGTPDANGAVANSTGFLKMRVVVGVPGPPEDSGAPTELGLTDVRCKSGVATCGPANATGGADYTGELRAAIGIRLTDKYNGASLADPATVSDFTLGFSVPCAATADTSIGANCHILTEVNALYPGAVKDTKRTIFELGQVQVLDGGPDGDGDTAGDNSLFAVQGIFVP